MGHFVPRLRLGLVSLGWAAPAGLGCILRFLLLLFLILGRSLFRGLAFRCPFPGSGKIPHFSSEGWISRAGDRGLLLVLARRRTRFRRSQSTLIFWGLRLGRGRLNLHRGGSNFGRLYISRLGGTRLPSKRREYSFYRQPPKNLLRCETEKASAMAGNYNKIIPPFCSYCNQFTTHSLSVANKTEL